MSNLGYKDNNEKIIIPQEDVVSDIKRSIDEVKKLQKIPYHTKPLIIEFVKIAFKCISINGCDHSGCPNRRGVGIDFNIIRYDLVDFMNKNKKKICKVFGPPREGLYEEKQEDEEDSEENFFDGFEDKFGTIQGKPCDYCKDLPFIYYKKGEYHFFECPRCTGIKIHPDTQEKFRVNVQ